MECDLEHRTLDHHGINAVLRCAAGVVHRADDNEYECLAPGACVVFVDLIDPFLDVDAEGEPNGDRLLVEDRGKSRVVGDLGFIENPPEKTYGDRNGFTRRNVEARADLLDVLLEKLRG
jgi:hypothetical protein